MKPANNYYCTRCKTYVQVIRKVIIKGNVAPNIIKYYCKECRSVINKWAITLI